MKLVNPLDYPWAVLAGGITLVVGIRLIQLPSYITLPTAAAIATGLAMPLKRQETQQIKLNNPELVKEMQLVKQQTKVLTEKAQELRTQAQQMLTLTTQLELLAAVEYACDRVLELPGKIDWLSQKLQGSDSLLSSTELKQQLAQVLILAKQSSGAAKQQLNQLATSLANNLELVHQGQDARQAQVVSLKTLVSESAGVLQRFQNRLLTSNLNNSTEINELQSLTQELKSMQDNVDLLIN